MKKIIIFALNLLIVLSLFSSVFSVQKVEAGNNNISKEDLSYSFVVDKISYESPIVNIKNSFTGISSKWSAAFSDRHVYLKANKEEWVPVTTDDGKDGDTGYVYGEVFNVASANTFQYKVDFLPQDIGKEFKINFSVFDTSHIVTPSIIRASSDNSGLGPRIISRAEWGANEKYMTWAPEYDEVKAFVIHHTAGEEGAKYPDQMSVVRNLYYGHAVGNGWGDIGYNYVIDANGVIYEGRSGGGGVVGGHTLGYNYGTIGIVLIGDYDVRNVEQAQQDALANLIAYKSYQYGINPDSMVYLKNKNIQTVVGHRDLNSTNCPGTSLYGRVSDTRFKAKDKLATYQAKRTEAQIVSVDNGAKIYGGDSTKVRVSLKNTGNIPWYPKGSGAFTINGAGGRLSATLDNFGRSVEPGEVGNFYLNVTAPNVNENITQSFESRVGGNLVSGGIFNINLNVTTPDYRAKVVGKSADQILTSGKQATLWVDVKNGGKNSWNTNSGIKLYTRSGANSAFYTSGDWENQSIPGIMDNPNINSGSTGRISFLITAPSSTGLYNEKFTVRSQNISLEGGADLDVSWNITVGAGGGQLTTATASDQKNYSTDLGDYNYQIVDQSSYLDMKPGEVKNAYIEIKNTGKSNWYKDTFRLAPTRNQDRESAFANSSWKAKNRIEMSQALVTPGQNARFNFTVTAPQTYKNYQEYFSFVVEGVGWLPDIGMYWNFNVTDPNPTYSAEVVDKGTDVDVGVGSSASFTLKIKNTGNINWSKNIVHLGVVGDKAGQFADSSWLSPNRIGFAESAVAPGATATFSFTINTSNIGNYQEKMRLVAEGLTWFGDEIPLNAIIRAAAIKAPGVTITLNVTGGTKEDFDYVSQSPFVTMNAGESKQVWLEVKNTGTTTWHKTGTDPVRLATANPRDRGSDFIASNRVIMDKDTVAPGENVRFTFNITAPAKAGTYKEYFTLVHDGVAWFKDIGIFWQITVNQVQADQQISNNIINGNSSAVLAGVSDAQKVKISSNGPFIIVNGAEAKLAEGGSGDSLEAFYKDGKHYFNFKGQLYPADGWVRVVPWAPQTILTVDSYSDRPAWNQSINDNKFKGAIEVRYSAVNKKLWVIDDLNIEDYLKGVSEPLESGPYEYIKTAIVAERSYIYYHLQRGGRWPDDFITLKNSRNGNGDDQIYQGYGFTSRANNIPRAVDDTRGEVATYNGSPVLTPYYTQSDGRTRSISEVWGSKQSDYPWLVSVPDPWCAGKQMLGHGVGMSGTGARGMAADGKSYKDILNYFYTGTSVGKIDTNRNVRVGIYYISM